MTHLKNIICVFTLLALGLAAQAQSTALRPYEGATHTYTWNGLAEGLNYEFYMASATDGSGVLDDISTMEFDFVTTPTGSVGTGQSTASVPILWNNGASAHVYYLWIKVTAPGGCSNQRYVEILPQVNAFDLLSENIPVDNTESCPAVASADGFNPLAATYDAGSTTLKFKVRRVNGTDNKLTATTGDTYNWKFEPILSVDPTCALCLSIVSVEGANSGTLTADAGNLYTVLGTDSEVTVTVSIRNLPGATQNVHLKIQNQSEENTHLLDSNAANDIVTHRVKIMPVIGGMNGV